MASSERELHPTPTIADLVMIELMQADDGCSQFHANVDLNISREIKRLHRKDSRRWLPRLIAERARLYVEHVLGVNPVDIENWFARLGFLFVFGAVFVVVGIAVLHGLGTTSSLFSSDENEASIGGLMWLIVVPPLLCVPALLGALLLLFRRRPGVKGGRSWLMRGLKSLTIPGMMLVAVRGWSAIRRQQGSVAERALRQFASDKAHIVTGVFLAASNAFMLLLSVAAFLAVFHFLLFNEVSYAWRSSLLTADAKVAVVRSISAWAPLVDAPSEQAVQWAFGASPNPGPGEAENWRAEWSSFVVRSLAVATLLPRIVIALLTMLLLRRGWRELMPDASDPQIDQMVDNIVVQSVASTTAVSVPEMPAGDDAAATAPAAAPATSRDAPAHGAEARAPRQVPENQASGNGRWQVVAYALPPAELLRLEQTPARREPGVAAVDGAGDRRAAANAVAEDDRVSRVLILASATTVPDAAFGRFLGKLAAAASRRGGRAVVGLVGLQDHLERVEGDAERHRERIQKWRLAVQKATDGGAELRLVELQTTEGRDVVEQLLDGEPPADSPGGPIHRAGKADAAIELLRDGIPQAIADMPAEMSAAGTVSEDAWKRIGEQQRERLLELYAEEYQAFSASSLVRQCREKLSGLDVELPDSLAGKGHEALSQGIAAYRYLGSLMSPKWLVPGAIAGIGVGALTPLLAGGAPLLLAVLPSVLPAAAATGAAGGALAKHWLAKAADKPDADAAPPPAEGFHGMDMDATVRGLLLLVVMLEFQANDTEAVSRQVQRHLGPVTAASIVTVPELHEALDRLQASLQEDREAAR